LELLFELLFEYGGGGEFGGGELGGDHISYLGCLFLGSKPYIKK
jgi:hypothetical protein